MRAKRLGEGPGVVLAAMLAAAVAIASPAPEAAAAQQVSRHVAFEVTRTRIRVGQTSIIPLRRANAAAAAASLELAATPADPAIVEVVAPARLLEGEPIGYVRIRSVAPGRTTLTIDGAVIEIEVVPGPDRAASDRPAIDGPATGAAVWGRITVGMHFTDAGSSESASPRVIVDDGARPTLEAGWVTGPEQGPTRLAAFTLDADALGEGIHSLTPVVVDADGHERTGDPVRIRIVQPSEADLVEGEAETAHALNRPEQFGEAPPPVQQNASASGGAFAVNNSAYPPVCFPLKVDEAGWYQVMLRAGGTLAGGTLPTVALLVDESYEPRTNAPLLTTGWHRLALGVPVLLRPSEGEGGLEGGHAIIPFFGNDFYVAGLTDRNLWLDKIEILRIGDAEGYRDSGGVLGAATMAGTNAGEAPMADGDSPMMAEQPMQMQDAMTMGAMSGSAAVGIGPARVAIDIFHDLAALERHPARIAFAKNLHNAEATGQLEVKGVCWWEGMSASKPAPPPTVALELNGWEVSKQRSAAPTFWIDTAYFTQRENTIRLIARLDDGTEVASALQTVIAPWIAEGALPSGFAPPRAFHRFTTHDQGWDEDLRRRLRGEHDPEERVAAAFYSNAIATLTLPEDLEGTFDLHLNARGQHFEGAPILQISLEHENGIEELEPFHVPEWWGPHAAGRITIPAGAKELKLTYRNDKYQVGRGDRNLWLQAVLLQEIAPPLPAAAALEPGLARDDAPADGDFNNAAAPITITIAYPPDSHDAWMADAIIAHAHTEAGGIHWAELLWDGQPTGIRIDMPRGVNPIVLHVPLRDIEPGPHEAAVRIADLEGNLATSAPIHINVLSQPPPQPGTFARAAHLLNRFAYGPAPDELAAVLVRGERAWLEEQMRTGPDDPGLLNAITLGLVRFGDRRSAYDVPRRAIEQARLTPAPARARLVFWAQNHFSTWIRKSEPTRKWDEHLAFTRLGAAPFVDLLRASARSPAMLRYLDQDQSFADKINENYAREIMELHTLGVDGGYDQQDVVRLAGLLTGWMAADQGDGRSGGQGAVVHRFRFDPTLCDPAAREVLGYRFDSAEPAARYGRANEALELLAAHPSTARHVCEQLVAHYVAFPPDEALVDHLARVFKETGGDLAAVVVELAASDVFWAELAGGRERLNKPVEHGLRIARTTGEPLTWAVGEYLDLSGMGLFDRSTPDGYPEEDEPYSDSNAMLQRWRLARQAEWAIASLVPGPWRWGEAELDEPTARRAADIVSIRLTGRPLSEASLDAALPMMLEGRGTRDERLRRGATLVGQLPEASLK